MTETAFGRRVAIAAAVWLGICSLRPFSGPTAWAAIGEGDPVPSVTLTDIATGTQTAVSEVIQGSDAALVLMQTSCASCRQELLALKEIQARHPGFKVVALCVDTGPAVRVQRYKEHFGFEFTFLHDPDSKVLDVYGFSYTPGLVLVDRQGRIVLHKSGYAQGDDVMLMQKVGEIWGRQK